MGFVVGEVSVVPDWGTVTIREAKEHYGMGLPSYVGEV